MLPVQEWKISPTSTLTTGGASHANPSTFAFETEGAVWIFPEQQFARTLVNNFKKVSQLKSICITFGADGYTVWSLLDSYDRDAREKIYEQELKICESMRIYDFDFRVTSIDLVTPEELINTGSIEIYRRN